MAEESLGVAERSDVNGSVHFNRPLATVPRSDGKENMPTAEYLKDIKNRILVSNRKNPLSFFLNLAKRYIKQYGEIELCGLGKAIPTVVTISEILKKEGLATEKKLLISSIRSEGENGRVFLKSKIEIRMKAVKHDDATITAIKEDLLMQMQSGDTETAALV